MKTAWYNDPNMETFTDIKVVPIREEQEIEEVLRIPVSQTEKLPVIAF